MTSHRGLPKALELKPSYQLAKKQLENAMDKKRVRQLPPLNLIR